MKYKLSNPLWIHEKGKRTNQEDSIFPLEGKVSSSDRVFILCDGMGGHEAGEIASSIVCKSMGQWLNKHVKEGDVLSDETLQKAIDVAYNELDKYDKGTSDRKMGTTMTCLVLHAGGATIAHIGDSRVYQLRPGTPTPIFKTRDHSLVNDLVRLGEITEEEARNSPNRNVITRAMQPNCERRSKADVKLITDVRSGDWFYLCSDGMNEFMEDEELISLLTNSTLSEGEIRDEFIRRTSENKDNHSAWLIHIMSADEKRDKKESVEDTDKEKYGQRKASSKRKHRNLFLWFFLILALVAVAVWLF